MEKPVLVIMAAGMSSRYGSLKQIDPVDEEGHIIIDFSVFDAHRAGFDEVIFLIKKNISGAFHAAIGDRVSKYLKVSYAYQELDMLPEGITLPEGREKPLGRVLGVARHKPDAEIARNGVDLAKELREIHILVQSPAIGVHVLAKERNILIPGGDERFGLAHDVLAAAGALAPADVGDDAVRAEVVAPVHDGEPGLHAAFPLAGETFGNGFGALGIEHAALRLSLIHI